MERATGARSGSPFIPTALIYLKGTMWLVNPAIVVKNWNQSEVGISLELNGTALSSSVDFRSGYEQTEQGKDLVIWLNKTIDLNAVDEHRVEISIIPKP